MITSACTCFSLIDAGFVMVGVGRTYKALQNDEFHKFSLLINQDRINEGIFGFVQVQVHFIHTYSITIQQQ